MKIKTNDDDIKYSLLATFSRVVVGFCNTPEAISALGDEARITSLSLRSLCKTVLEDISLSTASAADRSARTFKYSK